MALDWLLRPVLHVFIIIFVFQFTCAPSISESEALIKLKSSFTNATALSSWVPGSAPCEGDTKWKGLVCSNGIVTGIRLEEMGLSGKIDVDALVDISGLRSLSFEYNSFSGSIPELNRLSSLKNIFLTGNQFSGEIPAEFFLKMASLKKVWLAKNKFSGEIPPSLLHLSNLIELHLEENQFSGTIPPVVPSKLKKFNVSNNKLSGEIPDGLAKFSKFSFEGNADLCGKQIGKECKPAIEAEAEAEAKAEAEAEAKAKAKAEAEAKAKAKAKAEAKATEASAPAPDMIISSDSVGNIKKTGAGIIALAVMLFLIGAVIICKMRRKDDDEDDEEDDAADEIVEVQVSLPIRQKEVDLKKKPLPTRKAPPAGAASGGVGELVIMNDGKGNFGLMDLMKSSAEVLGNGGLGSSYKALMANGVTVVVKRLREMNAFGRDGFDAELRKLGRLRHPNILPPLAFHFRKDEKLLIYEYISKGSLLYLLHGEKGALRSELNWPARLKIVQGIARGLGYLHTELASCDLPHGNLKSSNILLNPDNEPLLAEFGFSPLANPSVVGQALIAYKAPEVTESGVSPKCDVYCLGLVILEILTGKYPHQYVNNGTGGIDLAQWAETTISEGKECEILDPEIASSSNSLGEMKQLLHIGALCAASNPIQRLELREAIQRIEMIKLESTAA